VPGWWEVPLAGYGNVARAERFAYLSDRQCRVFTHSFMYNVALYTKQVGIESKTAANLFARKKSNFTFASIPIGHHAWKQGFRFSSLEMVDRFHSTFPPGMPPPGNIPGCRIKPCATDV